MDRSFIFRLHSSIARRGRIFSLLAGSLTVLGWTVYRHITNGVNYDVVGQIGLAQQWAHGQHAGAQLGTTNYLLKMPLYLLVNQLHILSPMHRLLLLAVICNLLTFGLLYLLFESFLRLYNVPRRGWLYVAYLWLATIAGNVFWADYANSRNLETAGGLFFLYCGLRFIMYGNRYLLAAAAVAGGLVFFADNLQFYVCGLGLCLYAVARAGRHRRRTEIIQAVWLVAATVAAFAVSRLLFALSAHWLHTVFLQPPKNRPLLNPGYAGHLAQGLATATLKIFGADFLRHPYTAAGLRELLNALVLLAIIAATVRLVRIKPLFTPLKFWGAVLALNYAVYGAGGQVLQWETQRYLIMVPLIVTLLTAVAADRLELKHPLRWQYAWVGVSLLGCLALTGAVVHAWPTRHSKDSHIYSVNAFLQIHHFSYALAPRDTGITSTYFSNDDLRVLPMGCAADHRLQPTTLFYDQAAYSEVARYHGDVPVLLQNNKLTFGPLICTRANIITQFGKPVGELSVPGYGTALVYKAATVGKILNRPGTFSLPPFPTPRMAYAKLLEAARPHNCSKGTLDIIMAHPDDDILFTNPDLSDQLQAGRCVRSVYVTSGDDGRHSAYWHDRESGIKAAYAYMVGLPDSWSSSAVTIDDHQVMISSLKRDPSVILTFLRLPDGGVEGKGFASTGHSSLKKAAQNQSSLKTIDDSGSYTYTQLLDVLATIIANDRPAAIFTHVIAGPYTRGDHSDHTTVGNLVVQAAAQAQNHAAISTYVGYPNNTLLPNLPADTRAYKRAIFSVYALHDPAVCETSQHCSIDSTYGNYFGRRYAFPAN